MQKIFFISGTLLGALAVMFGAFGAHALKARLSPDALQIFETGVRYQFYHAFALILLVLVSPKIQSTYLTYSGICFLFGVLFFSGSLYLLSMRELLGIDSWKSVLGPITPLGGLSFIMGWIFMLAAALKSRL
ncbi:MAG: DUF423 domain-containing protein [Bacteroidia bacterium]